MIRESRAWLVASCFLCALALAAQQTTEAISVPLRIVVLTEDDGSNAAASLKQIEQQIMQLRNDAERHGIRFVTQATTFVADSRRRHADAEALARASDIRSPRLDTAQPGPPGSVKEFKAPGSIRPEPGPPGADFPSSKDAVVIYVTKVSRSDSTAAPYVLRSPGEPASQPAIVIDGDHFGGQGCGPAKETCRTLTLALADALSKHASEAGLRDATEKMKKEVLRTNPG